MRIAPQVCTMLKATLILILGLETAWGTAPPSKQEQPGEEPRSAWFRRSRWMGICPNRTGKPRRRSANSFSGSPGKGPRPPNALKFASCIPATRSKSASSVSTRIPTGSSPHRFPETPTCRSTIGSKSFWTPSGTDATRSTFQQTLQVLWSTAKTWWPEPCRTVIARQSMASTPSTVPRNTSSSSPADK